MSVSITYSLERNAAHYGDRTAVLCDGRVTTWAQMARRCRALAGGFNALGLTGGDRIGFLGLNSEWFFECYFAPALAGMELVALNYRLTAAELIACASDSALRLLVVDPPHLQTGRAIAAACPGLRLIVLGAAPGAGEIGYEALIAAAHAPTTAPGRDDDSAIIYYSGGTTGAPKGVMLSHWNICTNSAGSVAQYGFVPHETHLMVGPMFHAAAGSRVYTCAHLPAPVVLQPKFDVAGFLGLIQTHRVASTQFVPTMMQMILDHPEFARYDLSSLRQMTWGASATSAELLRRIVAAFPHVDLVHGYGMTEAAPLISGLGPDYHRADFATRGKLGSVGFPASHCDLRIFDDADTELPRGAVGEIVVRGPNVMKGYLNQPELTAETLRGGWLHTGDAGYLDADGALWISGRIKDMIISGGENIYPAEIENVLSLHPDVAEVAVIGIPDPHWGEAVHAIVIPTPGSRATETELITYTRAHLASYKCPRSLEFRSEPMPLSGANKVLKTELRKPYWNTT
ncbi:MAG: long-chain fatty acid--CoA ligase [Pseudodonghicola sp.]